jgi:hypothetical protein
MATYTIQRNEVLAASLQQQAMINIGNRGAVSFKSDLQEIWEGVQGDRADMLRQVRTLQLAMQLLMQGESRRLALRAPNDTRIALLATIANQVNDRVAMLDEEISVSDVRVPMVKKTEALLNGRITDDAAQATGPLTVTLADEKGTAIPGVPSVETDSAGYYALVIPTDAAAALKPDQKLQVVLSNGNERVATAMPVSLQAGAMVVHDIGLTDRWMDALKLRVTVLTPVIGGVLPVKSRMAAKGVARKEAAAGKKKPSR